MRSFGDVFEKYVDDKSTPYLSDDNGHLATFNNYALPLKLNFYLYDNNVCGFAGRCPWNFLSDRVILEHDDWIVHCLFDQVSELYSHMFQNWTINWLNHYHYSDVIMTPVVFEISWLFAQPFLQTHIKENTKAPIHWPLWGESTGWLGLENDVFAKVSRVSNAEMFP